MDSSSAMNHSDFQASDVRDEIFNGQDKEFLSVLEDLVGINDPLSSQNKIIKVAISEGEGRISGYFCSDTVLNSCHRILTETEIKVLKKGLDYAPIQKEINEPVLTKDFSELCQRMRNRLYFRNEPTPKYNEVPCFKTKSSWKPPNDRPVLKIFLSKLEKYLFNICQKQKIYSNFNSEDWIKKSGKGILRGSLEPKGLSHES